MARAGFVANASNWNKCKMNMDGQQQDEIGSMNDVVGDNLVIKATSDLFIATLLSAQKNEPILRGLINAVLQNSGQTPIKSAEVLLCFE